MVPSDERHERLLIPGPERIQLAQLHGRHVASVTDGLFVGHNPHQGDRSHTGKALWIKVYVEVNGQGMTTTTTTTHTQLPALVERFIRFLEQPVVPERLFASGVVADFNIPRWHYRLDGVKALTRQLDEDAPNGATVKPGRFAETATGFVLEAEYDLVNEHGEDRYYRTIWLVETRDELITEVVLYCSGGWDAETRLRHAEARTK